MKNRQRKIARWQKIAEEAAKQSGRGVIPQVAPIIGLKAAVQEASKNGEMILFFEGGDRALLSL